jgi:hypothetical protein
MPPLSHQWCTAKVLIGWDGHVPHQYKELLTSWCCFVLSRLDGRKDHAAHFNHKISLHSTPVRQQTYRYSSMQGTRLCIWLVRSLLPHSLHEKPFRRPLLGSSIIITVTYRDNWGDLMRRNWPGFPPHHCLRPGSRLHQYFPRAIEPPNFRRLFRDRIKLQMRSLEAEERTRHSWHHVPTVKSWTR